MGWMPHWTSKGRQLDWGNASGKPVDLLVPLGVLFRFLRFLNFSVGSLNGRPKISAAAGGILRATGSRPYSCAGSMDSKMQFCRFLGDERNTVVKVLLCGRK